MKEEEADQLKDIINKMIELEHPQKYEGPKVSFVTICDLDRYELRYPINVCIEYTPDNIMALWPDVETWGEGSDLFEAVDSLKENICSLADDLFSSNDDELGSIPKMWKRSLKLIIKNPVSTLKVPIIPVSEEDEKLVDDYINKKRKLPEYTAIKEAARRAETSFYMPTGEIKIEKVPWYINHGMQGPACDDSITLECRYCNNVTYERWNFSEACPNCGHK